jgi:hypothetical protein
MGQRGVPQLVQGERPAFVVEVSIPRLPRDITAAEAPPAASPHQGYVGSVKNGDATISAKLATVDGA